jgi:hypothetical protein
VGFVVNPARAIHSQKPFVISVGFVVNPARAIPTVPHRAHRLRLRAPLR